MTKLIQYNMVDLSDVQEGMAIAERLKIDMHYPDIAVLHDVYYSIEMAKPCRRSRRRFNTAMSNLRRMSHLHNLKSAHHTRDGRVIENIREECGALFGEINGKTCTWYLNGRANSDKETPGDIINV